MQRGETIVALVAQRIAVRCSTRLIGSNVVVRFSGWRRYLRREHILVAVVVLVVLLVVLH